MNKTVYFLLGFISLFFFIYTIVWGIVGIKPSSVKQPTMVEADNQNDANKD